MMVRTYTALIALTLVVLFDVATTVTFRGMGIPESNPLMVDVVDQTWLFIGTKVGLLAVFVIPAIYLKVTTINRFIYLAASILGVAVALNIYAIVVA